MDEPFPCPTLALPGDPTRSLWECRGLPASPAHTFHSFLSFSLFPISWGDFNVPVACARLWELFPRVTEAQRKATCPVSTSLSLCVPARPLSHLRPWLGQQWRHFPLLTSPRLVLCCLPKRGCPFLVPGITLQRWAWPQGSARLCCGGHQRHWDSWGAAEPLPKHLECCTWLRWISGFPAVQPVRLELGNAGDKELRR